MTGNLDRNKIERLCKRYNYSYKYFGSTVLVTTGVDQWKLSTVKVDAKGNPTLIKIDHMNTAGNKNGKMKFHKQRHSNSLDFIFNRVISTHESTDRVYNNMFNIKELLLLG